MIQHLFTSYRLLTRLFLMLSMILLVIGCDLLKQEEDNNNNTIGVEHTATISVNETWGNDQVHIVKGYLSIEGATLTIEPGATVKMSADAYIVVKTGGGLIADGTTAAITFTSDTKQKGFWNYIHFESDAVNANCKLINCTIEYGGGYGNADDEAMIYIENNATVTNSVIRYSASNGVEIDDDARPVFTNNTITSNDRSPIRGYFESAPSIGTGAYTGNSRNYILLRAGTIGYNSTLLKQTVPYRLTSWNYIEATVTVQAGTTIEMDADAYISVREGAGLIADGSSEQIIFTGAVGQKGYWNYIEFTESATNANCKLINCLIEFGGGYGSAINEAMLYIYNNATIKDCLIRNSAANGVEIDDDARPVFTNNTVTLNDHCPIYGDVESAANIGKGVYTGNTKDYMRLRSGTIAATSTLLKQDVPYRLEGWTYIEGGTLTIEAGTVLEMDNEAYISVKDGSGLIAIGTSTDSIKFTGAVKQKGYWNYIEFTENATNANCKLDKCVVEWGGGYGTPANEAMIYLGNTAPTVINSRIQHSASWGIEYRSGKSPVLLNNIYYDNTSGDVRIY
jgi:hypothetical protein